MEEKRHNQIDIEKERINLYKMLFFTAIVCVVYAVFNLMVRTKIVVVLGILALAAVMYVIYLAGTRQVWLVDDSGITCYFLGGKLKMSHHSWDSYCFVGLIPVKSESFSVPSGEKIVCSKAMPQPDPRESELYRINLSRSLTFIPTVHNIELFEKYYK